MMDIDGFLNINKPPGPSSHDIVRILKRLLNTGTKHKIGHTGTLDPPASGVLVIGIGKGNRLAEYVLRHPKEYTGIVKLGIATDTLDSKGEITDEVPVPDFTETDLNNLIPEFTGKLMQVPPVVSALKKDGERYYVKARRGDNTEPDSRPAEVYSLSLKRKNETEIELAVKCASGFYVRSLARDIAIKLGTAGHLDSLVRTSVGGFSIGDSITIDWIEEHGVESTFSQKMFALDFPLDILPRLELDETESVLFRQGMKRWVDDREDYPLDEDIAIYNDREFIGIGTIKTDDEHLILKPRKVLSL